MEFTRHEGISRDKRAGGELVASSQKTIACVTPDTCQTSRNEPPKANSTSLCIVLMNEDNGAEAFCGAECNQGI